MKNKIIIGLWILIIIVGIVMAVTLGFNLSNNYGNSVKIYVDFDEAFELSDVDGMAKEVFGNAEYEIKFLDEFKRSAVIGVKEASEEQLNSLEDKLIEKYENFDKEDDVIHTIIVPSVSIIDLVNEYIKPIVITTVLVLIVLMIIFRKAGIVKALFIPMFIIVGMCALYVSIIAITRVQLSEYIIAGGVFVYAASLICAALYTKSKCNS